MGGGTSEISEPQLSEDEVGPLPTMGQSRKTQVARSTQVPPSSGRSSKWALREIDAYLIDLDGTIYSPSGPIEGAAEFYAAAIRHRPHVFLSNTGAKNVACWDGNVAWTWHHVLQHVVQKESSPSIFWQLRLRYVLPRDVAGCAGAAKVKHAGST